MSNDDGPYGLSKEELEDQDGMVLSSHEARRGNLHVREEMDIKEGALVHDYDKSDHDAYLERERRTVVNWEKQWGTEAPVQIERAKPRADYQSKLERILNLCDDEKRLDHMQFNTRNKLGHQARGDIDINGFKYTLTDRFVSDLDRALRPQQRHLIDQNDYKLRAGVTMFRREGGHGLLLWARERLLRDDPTLGRPVELVCFGAMRQSEAARELGVSRPTVTRRVSAGLDIIDGWITDALNILLSAAQCAISAIHEPNLLI